MAADEDFCRMQVFALAFLEDFRAVRISAHGKNGYFRY
jgi:hypothetical protein